MIAVCQMIGCVLSDMSVGVYAFLKALPFYEQLSGMKEQIIALAIGVPVALISLIFLISTIIRIWKKIFR